MQCLIDTGPLLALLDRNDKNHGWVCSVLSTLSEPLITTEAVLSEVVFLLKRQKLPITALTIMLERQLLIVYSLASQQLRISALLKKYADLPTSYADASLVILSEIHKHRKLITVDSDFRIYRREDRTVVPCEMPQ